MLQFNTNFEVTFNKKSPFSVTVYLDSPLLFTINDFSQLTAIFLAAVKCIFTTEFKFWVKTFLS